MEFCVGAQRGPHGNTLPCGSSYYLPYISERPWRGPRNVYLWVLPLDPDAFLDELRRHGNFPLDP